MKEEIAEQMRSLHQAVTPLQESLEVRFLFSCEASVVYEAILKSFSEASDHSAKRTSSFLGATRLRGKFTRLSIYQKRIVAVCYNTDN